MNKHLHRIIFNHALGLFQVVSEIVRRPGGRGADGNSAASTAAALRPMSFALWCALGWVFTALPSGAQEAGRIITDPGAPGNQRPTVVEAGNGVPVVNITTPSAAGVSRNTYSQFDVNREGVILNNSRTDAQTHLGGWVAGNPWLATGGARVILNEVNSANPSYLNGYVEVAGQRAEVIIANPAGIQVDGGGFINASRATLTTGTPVFAGGALDHYRVSGGSIRIEGAGLDNTRVDYTDLISRSLVLNGGLWAQQASATLGTNTVSANGTVSPVSVTDIKPSFALDVGALGGMYANKIFLVGTEAGVGVRNAGKLGAQAGELTLTVDGRIENTGAMQAQTHAHLTAASGLANAGIISAGHELKIDTPADVDNSGGALNGQRIEINAASLRNRAGTIEQTGAQALAINAGVLSNRDGGRIGLAEPSSGGDTGGTPGDNPGGGTGGVSPGGETGGEVPSIVLPQPLAEGALNIAGLLDNDGGRINAGGGLALNMQQGLDNSGGHLGLSQLTLTQGDLLNVDGELSVAGDAHVAVERVNNDGGDFRIGGALNIAAQQLSNRGGSVTQGGTGASRWQIAGTLDNTDGTLATNASSLALDAATLVNQGGHIEHAGTEGLTIDAEVVHAADGRIVTRGAATLVAQEVDHRNATLSATQLTVTANNFNNAGGTVLASGEDASRITIANALNNDGGTLASQGDLSLSAAMLGNAAGIVQQTGAGTLAITAQTLNGAGGTLASNGALSVAADTMDVRGGTTSAQRIDIDSQRLITAGGTLVSVGADTLRVVAREYWDNQAGRVSTNGALQVSAGALNNTDGVLSSSSSDTSTVSITDTLDNTRGLLAASGTLAIDTGELINRDTLEATTGVMADRLTVEADSIDNANGQLAANDTLSVIANSLDNRQGQLSAANALDLTVQSLTGEGGTLASNGALTLRGQNIDLREGITSAQSIDIGTDNLVTAGGQVQATGTQALVITAREAWDNTAGTVVTNGALQLAAQSLNNAGGVLGAAGTGASTVAVDGVFDNTDGTLAATGALAVQAGELDNTRGAIQSGSAETLYLNVDGLLTNDAGAIDSNGDVALNAANVSNDGGRIAAAGNVQATVNDVLDNSGGALLAGGDIAVQAQVLRNADTATSPALGIQGPTVTLELTQLDNTGGQVLAAGALSIDAQSISNVAGLLDGNGDVSVSAASLDNQGGTIFQRGQGALSVQASDVVDNRNGGVIGGQGAVSLETGSLDNRTGTVFSQQALDVRAQGEVNNGAGGLLQSDGTLNLTAAGAVFNEAGVIDARQTLTLTATALHNAAGYIIAGTDADDASHLVINTVGALDNQGGTLGSRGGDVQLSSAALDNRNAGVITAGRDITLTTPSLDNSAGTVFATGTLRYENAAAWLINTGGQFGAGTAAYLSLASISNTAGGRIQAGTVWMNTPSLEMGGGEVVSDVLHAQLGTLSGLGRLYGQQWLEVDFSGNYTHAAGQRLESDGLLDVSVAGALTNEGALQTAGELSVEASDIINQGVMNASNAAGSGIANITAGNTLDNRTGASLESDTLSLTARDITNTGDIVGDTLWLEADTLTNGRDLGTALAARDYGEGFIGASEYLDIRVARRLSNWDAEIYSGGAMNITARDGISRTQLVENISGRLQAEGDLHIATEQLDNKRRMVAMETYALSAAEQYALGSQRQFDEAMAALTDAQRSRLTYLNGKSSNQLSAAEITEKKALNQQVGWQTVEHVSDEMLAAINHWYATVGAPRYGHSGGYVVDNATTPDDNPGGQVKQTDTYQTGQRLIASQSSAESRLISGGDMTLDVGQRVRNHASRIAAGGYLDIAGQGYTGTSSASDARIENIAIASEFSGTRETHAWVYPEVSVRWSGGRGVAELEGFLYEDITAQGDVLAMASITAGQGLNIEAGSIINTAVALGGDWSAGSAGTLTGADTQNLGDARGTQIDSIGDISQVTGRTVSGNTGPGAATGQVIGTPEHPLPGLVPPDNGMFDLITDENADFLVITAPRFAKGDGVGSDYLLSGLGVTRDMHKRLGDGYYEQRLVADQLLQLTGRRSLNGTDDAGVQYRALMDNAVARAQALGLSLGAPLTSAQIAALDSDIVWLVEQEINGQKVLVPVVYLSRATADKLAAEGALIAADSVHLKSSEVIRNQGVIAGDSGTWLSADTLINDGAIGRDTSRTQIITAGDMTNGGRIGGQSTVIEVGGSLVNAVKVDGLVATAGVISAGTGGLAINATQDIINQGQLSSGGHAVVIAGRDFVQTASHSTSRAGDAVVATGTLISAGSAVVNAGRDVVMEQGGVQAGQHAVIDAGRDATFIASTVQAEGAVAVTAGRDIISGTVTTVETTGEHTRQGRTHTYTTMTDETLHGAVFQGGSDVVMQAGQDISLTAATVHSAEGNVVLKAERDVSLLSGEETHGVVADSKSRKASTFSSTTTRTHTEVSDTYAVGTSVSGEKVAIQAGNDINVVGSTVISDTGTALMAGHDINVRAAENTHTEHQETTVKKSGISSDGGVGVKIGSSSVNTVTDVTEVTHTGSVIGSVGGRVDMYAGNHIGIQGSDVIGMEGVGISGKTVTIEHAEDTLDVHQVQKAKSSGVHISVKGGAADQAASAYGSLQRADEVEDDRLQALYVAKAAQAMGGMSGAGIAQQADQAASDAKNDGQTKGGMSLRIGVGASSSTTTTDYHASTAHGSNVYSGNGDVVVVAREGDLAVIGSTVEGVNTTVAAVKGDLILLSAEEATELREKSKAGSAEVGITLGSEAGVGVYISASAAKGKGAGNGTTYAETVIGGDRGTTTFISGGDTVGKGVQIIGETVVGVVGGDLLLQSQQDSNDYKRQDVSAGVDAAIGTGGGQVSGYANASQTKSTYTSVNEQTGIQAGAGGYNIVVKGHTQLDGAAIASTADPSKNYFETGSLDWTDTQNEAEYTSTSVGVSGGTQSGMNAPSVAHKQDSAKSTTKAGIADGTVIVHDGSGSDIAKGVTELQQDGLKEIFNQQKVAEELEMQGVAQQVTFTAVGSYAGSKTRDYENAKATKEVADKQLADPNLSEADRARWQAISDSAGETMADNQVQYDHWKDGGPYKTIAHAVAGAISGGNVQGALGAAAAELARPLTAEESKFVQDLVSFGIGGAVGGASGATSGLAGEVYNRQLHPKEVDKIEANAGRYAAERFNCGSECTPEQVAAAEQELLIQAMRQTDARWDKILGQNGLVAHNGTAIAFLDSISSTYSSGRQDFWEGDLAKFNDSGLYADKLRGTPELNRIYAAALSTANTPGEVRAMLQNLNRTDPDWADDFVAGVLKQDAWTVGTMFSGDVGFVAGVVEKIASGDYDGAADDVFTAIVLARLGAGAGKIISKAKGAMGDVLGPIFGNAADELPPVINNGAGDDFRRVLDEPPHTMPPHTESPPPVVEKNPNAVEFPPLDDASGPSAPSANDRVGLREQLAQEAGVPRQLDEVWGSSSDDLTRSFEMDGAVVTQKPPKAGTSGNGDVYTVEGHPYVKEFEVHAGEGAHGGSYYKFVMKDGTQVRVIDPKNFSPGTITKDQMYLDMQGNRLRYEAGEWLKWE